MKFTESKEEERLHFLRSLTYHESVKIMEEFLRSKLILDLKFTDYKPLSLKYARKRP